MIRTKRRARPALRIEALEQRSLLSTVVLGTEPASDHELLIRLSGRATSASAWSLFQSINAKIEQVNPSGSVLLSLPPSSDTAATVTRLQRDPDVAYAQLNHRIQVLSTPN